MLKANNFNTMLMLSRIFFVGCRTPCGQAPRGSTRVPHGCSTPRGQAPLGITKVPSCLQQQITCEQASCVWNFLRQAQRG